MDNDRHDADNVWQPKPSLREFLEKNKKIVDAMPEWKKGSSINYRPLEHVDEARSMREPED